MVKIDVKDYDLWISEMRKIHGVVDELWRFGKLWFRVHPKLMFVEESVTKLDELIKFLEKLKANATETPEWAKDKSGRWG